MTSRTIGRAAGQLLSVVGILILLFVAYQLWGTGIQTSHSQALLRQEFDQSLRQDRISSDTDPSSTTPLKRQQPATPAPIIRAPRDGQPVGTITIPAIGLNMVVIQGTTTDDLEQGPGHYTGTPLPGEPGNVAIAGHRTTYLHPFWALDALTEGDSIVVTTTQGVFTYTVSRSLVVSPSDVAIAGRTKSPMLTLTTCTPRFSAAERLVVQAKLTGSDLAHLMPQRTSGASPRTDPVGTARSVTRSTANGWLSPSLWGAAVLGICATTYVLTRRPKQRWLRVVSSAGGYIAALIPLFFFFEAISRFLPASF